MKKANDLNRDTIPYMLERRAIFCPHDTAFSFPEFKQSYTWSIIWREVQQIAKGFLELGIKKGDTIALLMPSRMELLLSMFATACVGAIIVPLNTYSKKEELVKYLKDSTPSTMIIGREGNHIHYPSLLQEILSDNEKSNNDCSWMPANIFILDNESRVPFPFRPYGELFALALNKDDQSLVAACREVTIKDPLILLYTSGTLGSPKGVLRSTSSFHASHTSKPNKGNSLISKMVDHITSHFTIMNLLPLYHLGGFGTIFTGLKGCNINIVMLSHFNPTLALNTVEKEKCRALVGTPFMINQMLASPGLHEYNLKSLVGVVFTSAAVTKSILQKVTKELNLYFFMVSYGSSEAGSVATGICFIERKNNLVLRFLYKFLKNTNMLGGLISQKEFERGSHSLAGKIDKRVEVKVLSPKTGEPMPLKEHGEIYIRSYRVMRYTKENKEQPCFSNDGWYKSGDLGFIDEKGHLTITGRLHRLISRGGEKISPIEIEDVLLKHNEVEDALVIGIPDELYGEQICACIVFKKGADLTSDKLRSFLEPYLSAFKLPRYFVFLPSFPMSATGKLSIKDIQQLAMDGIGELRQHA